MATAKKTSVKKTPQVTPISAWKKARVDEPVELPSGNVVRIRPVGFQAFLKAGLIPNSLMGVVQSAIDRGTAADLDVGSIIKDATRVQEMVDMVDNAVCFVMVEPEVLPAPKNEEDRDEDCLYVDEIDDEDKMYIFGICTGGPRDVETFRAEQANGLAAVQRSKSLAD